MSIRVALIYGSTREGRLCDRVAAWAAAELAGWSEFVVDAVDPAELGFPQQHLREERPAIAALREQIGRAEACIVVTAEYNHSYPAALKFLIDSINQEWHAKPVAFVSYGGVSGGLRAVEHLRQVFAKLHAVTIRDTVSFAQAWGQFDEGGRLRQPEKARRSLSVLLQHLGWWRRP